MNPKIDAAYEIYVNKNTFTSDPTWLEPITINDARHGFRIYSKEGFIKKILFDDRFNQKWNNGFTRDLTTKERFFLYKPGGNFENFIKQYDGSNIRNDPYDFFNQLDIPKRKIIE